MNREKIGVKKIIAIVSLSIIGSVIVSYAIFTCPRTFDRSYNGVKIRLGESDKELLEKVTISFEGTLVRNALLGHKFEGQIKIGDSIIPEQVKEVELKFKRQGTYQIATIEHFYYGETGKTEHWLYGWMIIDDAINHVMIQVAESSSDGVKGWDSEGGLTIVAPAATREEVLTICNKFYEKTTAIPFG